MEDSAGFHYVTNDRGKPENRIKGHYSKKKKKEVIFTFCVTCTVYLSKKTLMIIFNLHSDHRDDGLFSQLLHTV